MKSKIKYVVAGGLGIDHVISSNGKKQSSQFGGNAAYGSAGIHIWEKTPGVIGILSRYGYDFPEKWIQEISQAGIDMSGARYLERKHLLCGGWIYDEAGNRDETIHSNMFDDLEEDFQHEDPALEQEAQFWFKPDAEDIIESYEKADAVFIAAADLEKQLAIARKYRELGARCIIVDPSIQYMKPGWEMEICELLKYVDAFLPSQLEVAGLWGEIDPKEAAKKLGDMGAKIVVVKTGKEGCVLYETAKDHLMQVPCYLTDAEDPTGAGDSFCGGFLYGLLQTGDPLEAALHGTIAASFIVEGFGACHSLGISVGEAEARMKKLREMGGVQNES